MFAVCLFHSRKFLLVSCVFFCVFFFKQKTAYEMRISDWSSDVCSSDLLLAVALDLGAGGDRQQFMPDVATHPGRLVELDRLGADAADHLAADQHLVGHHLADHAGILAARKSTRLNSSH